MKSLFSGLTRLSLRFRLVTLIISAIVSVAGVVAVTQLRQELIPAIELPQTIILSQVSGMTSEQVLSVLTARLETALDTQVDEIINIESNTTGSFGAVLTAYNNFGENQTRLREEISAALDSVWLPQRRIAPPANADAQSFAQARLSEVTPDMLIYLAESDANFLFQLTPEVWSAFSDDTVRVVLSYLAAQTQDTSSENPLRQLIEQEISPALLNLPQIASLSISGGQALPTESDAAATPVPVVSPESRSLLFTLSPEVWAVVSAKAGISGALDDSVVTSLTSSAVEIPTSAPALPEAWQMDNFKDMTDILEMRTLTRTLGAVFNQFLESGQIVGSLGQTDDLTPETITQMLAIDPTMVDYFQAEHLAAMSDEVFAVLPDEFIAGLDGFTRDVLAARALAQAISGETADPAPVELPPAWRISPPQLITFSFDDLPLATFSVNGSVTAAPVAETSPSVETASTDNPATEPAAETNTQNIPEGPELPGFFAQIGSFLGVELDTADDLLTLQLPEEAAAQFGGTSLPPAQLLNFVLLLRDPESLPPGINIPPLLLSLLNIEQIIGDLSPDALTFIAQYDDTFYSTLSPDIYDLLSDEALSVDEIAPPLDQVWNTLANQPQFANERLDNAADIVRLGNGSAAATLNVINNGVPERFSGYEVRLFDSLTPGAIRYFALQEPEFFTALDPDVLAKLSPRTLSALPEDVLANLDSELAAQLTAIAAGNAPSAAEALASLYQSDVPAGDPNAPAINDDWAFVGDFFGAELDTADDFFRLSGVSAVDFLNSLYNSAQGAAFATNLFGGWTPEVVTYLNDRDPNLFNELRIEALRAMPAEAAAALPQSAQERLASGEAPFVPTDAITRTDGSSSMFITVYKTSDANTVEAFHAAEEALRRIDEADENITVGVSFEQASFIEESISGVAREGGLGAVFAVIVILVFLSGGAAWKRSARAKVGAVMMALFIVLLAFVTFSNNEAAGGDLGLAFAQVDVVVKVLLIAGAVIGLLIIIYPGKLPNPAWRSTLVTAVSIPLSVLMALALMRWLPGAVHTALEPSADSSDFVRFLLRLFPASITLNIMTLSGLTVAIGRVVDDSIVVLENIFRQIQAGGDRKAAIIQGTRDVSVAIFAATVITVVVFLPLGLTGGIIGEFFLPFGLAVTYSLLASFIVAITVVPVLAFLLLDEREISHEHEQSWLERIYVPVLRWALGSNVNRAIVLLIAFISLVFGGVLFGTRPQTFLPDLGEPQISVSVNMPQGTSILETNELASQLEDFIRTELPQDEITRVQTIVGSSGFSFETLLLGGGGVSENIASITIGVEASAEQLNTLTGEIRAAAEEIFGTENVTVSAASISSQGFGGFALVLSGPREDLAAINDRVIEVLNDVEGLANVSSNIGGLTGGSSEGPPTYIRINGNPAVSFTGELETENTLGVTAAAKAAVQAMPDLPTTIRVSEGFQTELQTQGFSSVILAMGIAIVIVIVILIITFGSLFHWISIILSIVVAPVGAAVLLTLTNRVLGISALIGLLMLIGIVVTNAVVLIDRVQANRRERDMNVHDALIEAGERRLRPILMTAIATVGALVPLAIGLSEGAIIASELGTVVIGGLVSSTLLTLIIVPVMYSIIANLIKLVFGEKKRA